MPLFLVYLLVVFVVCYLGKNMNKLKHLILFQVNQFVVFFSTFCSFLEYFPPGVSFVVISIAIRVIHAAGNAGTITSTFTYTAVEFPNSVAKIFVSLQNKLTYHLLFFF